MEAIFILFVLFMILLGIAATVFWIWSLVDCLTNKRINDNTKLMWTLLIIFIGVIASILYFAIGRNPRNVIQQAPMQGASIHVYQGYYQPQPIPPVRPMPPMMPMPPQGYGQAPMPPPAQPFYQPYAEGYQPQPERPAPRRDGPEQRQGGYEQYEQPYATYPEQQQQ